jgi:hypothetical protein
MRAVGYQLSAFGQKRGEPHDLPLWPTADSRKPTSPSRGLATMLDSQWYDRAKAIRQTIVQLRDSL